MMEHDTALAALRDAANYGDALRAAIAALRATSSNLTPELDAQLLLAHVLRVPRTTVLAYPERPLGPAAAAAYMALIARRAVGEPVAYLTGHREFMGLDFHTDARALIPRPETELLVEAALAEIRARLAAAPEGPPVVADIGTGGGAIAIAVAALEPRLPSIYATDISPDALSLAAENARHLGIVGRVRLLQGDLLAPLPEPIDVLLANLPYVAPRDAPSLAPDVRAFEPPLALYGDGEGLGHLRRLFATAPVHLRPGATLLLEFGFEQRTAVVALARAAFPEAAVRIEADYAGWDRFAIVRTSPFSPAAPR